MGEVETHDSRTQEQNEKFHAMVRDISRQVKWADEWLDEEQWKRLILGAAYGQLVVPNPFGEGLVVVNRCVSRKLNKPTMSELIEQMYAFGAERGVIWSEHEPGC